MSDSNSGRDKPVALALLASERPRNVTWVQAAGLLFGDWGTSRLYVLGLAFFFATRTSFYLICAMSVLILAVAWAYTQICRIYPDGGGVYTAAKSKSRTLAVVGALLLFADYTVTASLSALDAFHYYGLPLNKHVERAPDVPAQAGAGVVGQVMAAGSSTATGYSIAEDAGDKLHVKEEMQHERRKLTPEEEAARREENKLFRIDSPGLWAIVAIALIGLLNLAGPKHSGGFAIAAAVGMAAITLMIVIAALNSGKMQWHDLPNRIRPLSEGYGEVWIGFVSIVLALSGVEAIANLTGVMKKPVAHTAQKAIWVVAIEVAVFNILLALFMHNIFPLPNDAHKEDMLAYLSKFYMGRWGEWGVRIIGGTLLLSATNTAINGLMSIVYVVSRDGELPSIFQSVNRWGAPWVGGLLATAVPIVILIFSHDLEHLAALYAIGVIGAIAINVTLCSMHPRLRRMRRKAPMLLLGMLLIAIWITLAFTKIHALIFVGIVMAVGLTARALTKWYAKRLGDKPSLLRQAIIEQLPPDAFAKTKLLIGTYGSDTLAWTALEEAQRRDALLVVCFIRQVNLSYKYDGEQRLTIDTDLAALKTFAKFLELGHAASVPVLPVYDHGTDAAELLAENAAIYGCERVLIGTSRQGAIYHLIKGHFQRRLEGYLPSDMPVQVISPTSTPPPILNYAAVGAH